MSAGSHYPTNDGQTLDILATSARSAARRGKRAEPAELLDYPERFL